MRRILNDTRPTTIYWLVDTLTSVPFYCGKTVLLPERRLLAHRYDARKGTTRVNVKVRECGENVRIDTIEIVPAGDDWGAREKFWIATLRFINPNCCNTNAGGAGCPGRIVSEKTRVKLRVANVGRKHTPEAKAKVTAFLTGRKRSRESVEKGRAKQIGRKLTPEQCAAISERNKARYVGPQGEERRAAMGLRRKGVPVSDETRAKQSAAHMGKKRTPEQRARMSVTHKGRKMPAEAIAKSAAARTGAKRTPEQRARMSAAHKGKKWSQAQRDAIPAGLLASWKKRKFPPCPVPAPPVLA